MKNKFLVDPFLLIISGSVSLLLLVEAVVMFVHGSMLSTVVFLTVGLLFAYVAFANGSVITVDSGGVTRTSALFLKRRLTWNQVGEVGVCGTNVFNGRNKKKTGTMYIYISPVEMDDEARFEMILKWPMKNGIYLRYSSKRLISVQYRWNGEIILYNTGDFEIGEQKKN